MKESEPKKGSCQTSYLEAEIFFTDENPISSDLKKENP